MAKGPKLPGASLGDIDPGMISPKVLEQIQKYQQEQKASIAAQMKGSISAPIARSTTGLSEVTPKKETGKSESIDVKISDNLKSLVKESKDQNTNLKKIIKLNEKSIEDNSELFARLEKTMNALLDSVSEQDRKKSLGKSGSKGGVGFGEAGNGKGNGGDGKGGSNLLETALGALGIGAGAGAAGKAMGGGKGKGKGKGKSTFSRTTKRMGRGLRGGIIGGLLGGAAAGLLGEDVLGEYGGAALELGGAAAGSAYDAFTGKQPKKPTVEPVKPTPEPVKPTPTEPVVEPVKPVEPGFKKNMNEINADRYKFDEKTGRWRDTMKGRGGGEFITNAEAEQLGLKKTTTAVEPTIEPVKPTEPVEAAPKVEPVKPVEAAPKPVEATPKVEPVKPVEAPPKVEPVKPVEAPPKPAGVVSSAAEGVKQAGEGLKKGAGGKGGAVIGAILGVGLNEFMGEVSELKKAREEIIVGYQKKEIPEEDAIDALAKLDRKISESRGGSVVREGTVGAISGIAGTAAGTAATALALPATGPAAPAIGIAAGLGTGYAVAEGVDAVAGETLEKGGRAIGGAIHSLFGSSREDLAKELKQPIKPKEEAPKGNTEAGVTPDTDMGFQMTGRKEFDKDLVNQQAATPGVTPDIAGVMPSANEKPSAPEQPKGKVEKPLSEEATKVIDRYMKTYNYGLKAMMTVLPPETKKEDLVAATDEKYRFDFDMRRKLQEIDMTPGPGIPKKLKEKKLEAAEKLLQDKRIKNAESSDAGNIGTDYKATELTPTVETPTFDALGNAGGVDISGGEEVQSAMEAARASDEANMGLITTAREVSPEINKNSVEMQRASKISKFGRSNAMGMDAFMGYDEPVPVLPTADQVAQGQTEAVKKADAKAQMIAGQQPANNQAPIIVNQGDNINNVTNNTTSGGNSGGGGSPTRVPNPWDALTLGKSWEAYP
jgi:hypothetical protein